VRLQYDLARLYIKQTWGFRGWMGQRLKNNIRSLEPLLSKVNDLVPSQYAYINNNPDQKESIGFIAQDVKVLFPELVSTHVEKDGSEKLAIDYAGFGVVAIKAIQEQQEVIDQQATVIDELKKRLERIEKLLEK
jgi:hypothetical protein